MRRLAAIALVVVGCSTAAPDAIVLDEFSVAAPTTMSEGAVSLDVVNEGQFGHTAVVTDASGTVVASTDVIAGGESGTLDVDLAPGEYQISCRIVVETPDGELVDHYEEGMLAPLVVEG